MSARRLRVLAVVVCLVPGAASVVALLLAIWLSDDRWALTGILMVVLTIVGGFFSPFLATRANDVDSGLPPHGAGRVPAQIRELEVPACADRDSVRRWH